MIVNMRGVSYSSLVVLLCWLILAVFVLFCVSPAVRAGEQDQKNDSVKVMEAFEQQAIQVKPDGLSAIQKKHMAMFFLGVPLLVLLLITGGLGIAMGVYGKPVFMLHMIAAGLTITLAFVHAILGVIWFYPF